MPTQPPISSGDIARLVTEVLRRVRVEADERQTENSRIPPAAVTTVSDRVIAAETIVKLAPGTKVVHVARKAVITPSARDLARDRGIELVHTKHHTRQPLGSHLFLAQAECTADVSTYVSTIRRAVSTSQQLPSTGLATTLESLAEHAGRDAGRCILLTENTAVACVAANRFPAVRAILGSDIATVSDSIARCDANLVILNPRQFSAASMGQIAKNLTTQTGKPPEILSVAQTVTSHNNCSCRSPLSPTT